MNSSRIDRSIQSLARTLGSVVRKVVGDPRVGLERLAIACILPILSASALYYARTVIEVADPEQSLWIQLWISQQKGAIRRVRRLFLLSPSLMRDRRGSFGMNTSHNRDDESDEKRDRFAPPTLTFLPASGVSAWAWFGLWPISVSSVDGTQTDRYGRYAGGAGYGGYKVTVWFAPFGADIAKNLLLEGRKMWLTKRAQKTEIWRHRSHCHPAQYDVTTRKSRPLHSVIVENGIKEALHADAMRFLQSEEWYVRKGIPYRRGYLLYGPPGCGKTSLITALAGSLQLPIVLVALGSKDVGDSELVSALSGAPRDSIVLIEDVDCAFRKDTEDRFGRRPVTISGLLNAIDGVVAQEGRLLFLTTNHKEQLSEALIRPGRVDAQYHLGYASKAGAGELFDQFFPPSPEIGGQNLASARVAFVAEVEDNAHSYAKLQGVLMQARDDPCLAAKGMRALFLDTDSNSFFAVNCEDMKQSRVSSSEHPDDIQARIALLEHAATCTGCSAKNCKQVKSYFDHAKSCAEKPRSACKVCTTLIDLGSIHARGCSVQGVCPLPFCNRIREHVTEKQAAFVESVCDQQSKLCEQEEKKEPADGSNA